MKSIKDIKYVLIGHEETETKWIKYDDLEELLNEYIKNFDRTPYDEPRREADVLKMFLG